MWCRGRAVGVGLAVRLLPMMPRLRNEARCVPPDTAAATTQLPCSRVAVTIACGVVVRVCRYAWDAWDEFMPVAPAGGPRWFVAMVITHDPMRWFQPNSKRHACRLCVWNVKTYVPHVA